MNRPRVPKTDYAKISGYYDKLRPEPANILLFRIVEYGRIDANSTVLDVGCGTGRFPLSISAMKNCLICGLEPSRDMLKQAAAKDKLRKILWLRGDGQKLPFRDDFFDCVYMTLVIHHIENKETALREIHRTLKKGGKCVIMTTSHYRIKRSILNDFPGVTAIDLKRFPSVPSLKKTMIEIGFRDVHHHRVKQYEDMSTDDYLERVRKKYISTLTLLSEEAFQRGLKVFERKVRKKHGAKIRRTIWFDFVVGTK